VLKPDADVDECRAQILETWPVTIGMAAKLSQPLPMLIRAFVDNPPAQSAALEALRDAL
jgi:hypothetical protein